MLSHRLFTALALGMLFSSGDVRAQRELPGPHPQRSAVPGGTYRGQHIGFQPRHGRVHPPSGARPRSSDRPRSAGTAGTQSPVKAVSPTDEVSSTGFDQSSSIAHSPDAAIPLLPPEELPFEAVEGWEGDPSCEATSAGPCPPIAEPAIWVRGDYLLWWTEGTDVPELATTSPAGTPQADAGVLGRLNTSVLFGGNLLDDSRSGGRISLGFWLDPCHQSGLEFSYLGLDEESASFRGSGDAFSILARPFFDLQDANADSRLIVFPNLVEGTLAIEVSSEFQTAEVSLRRPGVPTYWSAIDFFVGYRFAELEDRVLISEATTSLAEPTTGTSFQLDDRFESRNQFNGGQIGVRIVGQTAPLWTTEFSGKFGLGNTSSRVDISGQTVVTPTSGGPSTQPTGLLVQGSNSGVFESDEFSTLSEFGLTLRRQIDCGWTFNFGYQFLLWTDVMRAGEQVDSTINVSQIPPGTLSGEARPAFRGETTDFWAQGLSFGLEYCY
jgi:hypothetical protein